MWIPTPVWFTNDVFWKVDESNDDTQDHAGHLPQFKRI